MKASVNFFHFLKSCLFENQKKLADVIKALVIFWVLFQFNSDRKQVRKLITTGKFSKKKKRENFRQTDPKSPLKFTPLQKPKSSILFSSSKINIKSLPVY